MHDNGELKHDNRGNDHDNGEPNFANLGGIQTLEKSSSTKRKINFAASARVGTPNLEPLILGCHLKFKFTQMFVCVSPSIS